MAAAPLPADETARLAALRSLDVLDSAPEPEFEAIVSVAALVCGAPISLITLVDERRQWFKANHGLTGLTQTAREFAFCAHTILRDTTLEVENAEMDSRFCTNPLVLGEPGIRFYHGVPLRLHDGARVGSLCVIDRRPRVLDEVQRDVLKHLATIATVALEARRDCRAPRNASGASGS